MFVVWFDGLVEEDESGGVALGVVDHGAVVSLLLD